MFVGGIFFLTILLVYDHIKIDWLLLESIKESQENSVNKKRQNYITKKIIFLRKNYRRLSFIILACWDPFITTVYFRDGHNEWNKIPNWKVFVIFASSIFLSNLAWSTLVLGIAAVVS